MKTLTYRNIALGTVVGPAPGAAGLEVHLEEGEGALFPLADFDVSAWDDEAGFGAGAVEYLRVDHRVGDTLYVDTRNVPGEANSVLQNIATGFQIGLTFSEALLTQLEGAVPVEYTGKAYVGLHGDDANDGSTMQRAKRTVQAGHDALPLDSVNGRMGAVVCGAGCFDEPSVGRLEKLMHWYTESPFIQCDNAKPGDVGAYIRALGFPTADGAKVVRYREGKLVATQVGTELKPKWTYVFTDEPGKAKWLELDRSQGWPARKNWSETPDALNEAIVDKPGLEWDPGASLLGGGRNAGKESMDSEGFPTVVRDYDPVAKTSGTGTLFQDYVGLGEKVGSGMVGGVIENISFLCTPKANALAGGLHKGRMEGGSNFCGISITSNWGLKLENVMVKGMGVWGIWMGDKATVGFSWGTVCVRWCGTESAKYGASVNTFATGGVYCATSPNSGSIRDIRCVENWGKGLLGGGIAIQASEMSHTRATAFVNSTNTASGVGLDVNAGKTQGTTDIEHGWFEGNDNYHVVGPSSEGQLSIDGLVLQGNRQQTGMTKAGIRCNNGTLRLGLVEGMNHAEATIVEGGSEASPGVISWAAGCICQDPKWVKGLKATRDEPASAATSAGRLNAGLSTRAPASTPVALVDKATWQNTLGYDVRLRVAFRVKAGARGGLALAIGRTSPGTALPGPIKLPAESEDVREFYVRTQEFLTPTCDNADLVGAEAVAA